MKKNKQNVISKSASVPAFPVKTGPAPPCLPHRGWSAALASAPPGLVRHQGSTCAPPRAQKEQKDAHFSCCRPTTGPSGSDCLVRYGAHCRASRFKGFCQMAAESRVTSHRWNWEQSHLQNLWLSDRIPVALDKALSAPKVDTSKNGSSETAAKQDQGCGVRINMTGCSSSL